MLRKQGKTLRKCVFKPCGIYIHLHFLCLPVSEKILLNISLCFFFVFSFYIFAQCCQTNNKMVEPNYTTMSRGVQSCLITGMLVIHSDVNLMFV